MIFLGLYYHLFFGELCHHSYMNERFSSEFDDNRPSNIEVSDLCDGATITFNTTFSLRGDFSMTYQPPHPKEDMTYRQPRPKEKNVYATHSVEPQILAMLLIRLVRGPAHKSPAELFDEIVQTVFPDQNISEDTEIDSTYPTRQWVDNDTSQNVKEDDVLKRDLDLNSLGGWPAGLILRHTDDGIVFIKKSQIDSEDVWSEDESEIAPTNSTMEFEETEVFTIDDTDLIRVAIAVAEVGLLGRAKEQIIPTLRGLIDSQGA